MPYGTEQHRSMRATLPEGPDFTYTTDERAKFEDSRRTTRPNTAFPRCCTRSISSGEQGYISNNAVRHVAQVIGCTTAEVEDVVSSWLCSTAPGRQVRVAGLHDAVVRAAGAERVVEELQNKLGIKVGETDPSGMFTIQQMECLGACDRAPVMMVNNDHWHEQLEPEQVERPCRSHEDRRRQGAEQLLSVRAAHRRGQNDHDARRRPRRFRTTSRCSPSSLTPGAEPSSITTSRIRTATKD